MFAVMTKPLGLQRATNARTSRIRPSSPPSGGLLWPKEHGVYAEWAFPTLGALTLGGFSPRGIALALVTLAGFLAHEPLLVALGKRGGVAKRNLGTRARRQLGILVLLAGFFTLGGLVGRNLSEILGFAAILLAGAAVTLASLFGKEKSIAGEIAIGATFAASVVPIVLVSGGDFRVALWTATVWTSAFSTSTLLVHTILATRRSGASTRSHRIAVGTLLLLLPFVAAAFPRWFALTPLWFLGVWVLAARVSPRQLRTLGWCLVVAYAAVTGLLLAAP